MKERFIPRRFSEKQGEEENPQLKQELQKALDKLSKIRKEHAARDTQKQEKDKAKGIVKGGISKNKE